jgi:two-component system response regulator PilR (NtrC family)
LKKILIVDDDRLARLALKDLLERNGYEVEETENGAECLAKYRPDRYLAVITDLKMPGLTGIEVLESLKEKDPEADVIVITAYGTIETAVDAIRKGAADYVTKPFEGDEILLRLSRIREVRTLREENRRFREQLHPPSGLHALVGKSKAMERVFSLIKTVADSHATVLIEGESGTGKELVAQTIHALSTRREGPFVPVSCAAFPENLLESELFGYEKGAFTGAARAKPGRFEMGNEGTVFLDDIDDVPLSMQVKLLRAIQERKIERLGSTTSREVDVRILASTKSDLREKAEKGEFREDLYYRLAVIMLRLPALQERTGDIPLLIQHFLNKYSLREGRPLLRLSAEAIRALEGYAWPGNVRELENVIERIVILCRGEICGLECLKNEIREISGAAAPEFGLSEIPDTGLDLAEELQRTERRIIESALEKCGGNKSQAAELLRIKRSTLGDRITKLGIPSSFS